MLFLLNDMLFLKALCNGSFGCWFGIPSVVKDVRMSNSSRFKKHSYLFQRIYDRTG